MYIHVCTRILHNFSRDIFFFSLRMMEEEVIQQCQDKLGLTDLEKDLNISPAQMTQCCERLMDQADDISVYMEGIRVRVTQYYSVTDNGLICLPWNWENDWKFLVSVCCMYAIEVFLKSDLICFDSSFLCCCILWNNKGIMFF